MYVLIGLIEKAVETNYQAIKERFIQLVLFVLQSLETLDIDIKDVCLAVSNFPCSPKHSNLLFFDQHREEIRNASTLRILFNLLSDYQYWDWKNYKLLHAIVSIFGTEPVKARVKEYEKELQAFYVNLKLSTLAETVPLLKGKPIDKPDFVRLTAKLEKGIPWADYTMQCVEEFWQSFCDEYLLNKYTLFFQDAKPGCACLTFLIPSAISPHIIVESQSKSKFLIDHNVVKLTLCNRCLYELQPNYQVLVLTIIYFTLRVCSLSHYRRSKMTSQRRKRRSKRRSKMMHEQESLKSENESLRELVQVSHYLLL